MWADDSVSQIRCQIDQRPNHVTCIIEQSSQNVLSPSSTGEVLWWCSLILPTLMKGIRIPYSLDCQWEWLLGYATTCQRALESGNSAEDTTLFKLDRLNIIDFQVQTGKSRLHTSGWGWELCLSSFDAVQLWGFITSKLWAIPSARLRKSIIVSTCVS